MAKTKANKKTQHARKAPKAKPAPHAQLAAFIKKVWSKPEMMEKFTASRAGRESVLEKSVLNAKHAELVRSGCVRHIMAALSNAAWENTTSNVNAADMVSCNHPECATFMAALKPTNSGPQLA